MSPWLIGSLLAAVACVCALVWLWAFRCRQDEVRDGLALLADQRWRELSTLIRQALHERRGFIESRAAEGLHNEANGNLLMSGEGHRWLLVCKHGRAYRIGAATIDEMAGEMRLQTVDRAMLLTEGRVERDAVSAASTAHVEIVNGSAFWFLLKPYVDPSRCRDIVDSAKRRAARHSAIAVLASLTAGLLVAIGVAALTPGEQSVAAGRQSEAVRTMPAARPAPPSVAALEPVPDIDDAEFARQQQAVSRALAENSGIVRGVWATRMTLAIDRNAEDAAVWPVICRELEKYPALRTVRVQLNPAPGSDEPVRWRQCRTY